MRAGRRAVRRRRRSLAAAIVVAAALVVGAVLVTRGGDAPAGSPSGDAAVGAERDAPSALLALAVTGGDLPVAAVVGAGDDRAPAALVLPSEMTVVVPGQGEVLMGAAAGLEADSMHVAVSNVVGTWTERYASMDLEELAALVDEAGGSRSTSRRPPRSPACCSVRVTPT